MNKTTEQDSSYCDIQDMSSAAILIAINDEDKKVAYAVEKQLSSIQRFVDAVYPRMRTGGRLIYVGAGTSGRLGVLDASEIPPTFGMDASRVVGIIAGGDVALKRSLENVEDNELQAVKDLDDIAIAPLDSLLGVTASGTTPYVLSACQYAKKKGLVTGGLCMNDKSPLTDHVDFPISIVVGAEFITGSTRMKSGTAQKMVLNMISTTLMVLLGRVHGNKMSHLQLSNRKLQERGIAILQERFSISYEDAQALIARSKNLAEAVEIIQKRLKV